MSVGGTVRGSNKIPQQDGLDNKNLCEQARTALADGNALAYASCYKV
jgi:hypothetical protein